MITMTATFTLHPPVLLLLASAAPLARSFASFHDLLPLSWSADLGCRPKA